MLLNKEAGLSHGKATAVMNNLFGLSLTRGASTQVVLRAATRLQPAHQEIQAELTNLYSKVQAQPEVSVSLREFNSDLVFVDGEPVRIGLKNVDSISVIVRSAAA